MQNGETNGHYGEESEQMDSEAGDLISQEDYWTIISSFFKDKGLVRTQLESYNEFIENTLQEIVDERARLTLDQHTQYTGIAGDETVSLVKLHSHEARTLLECF